ncbi:hypothetical protein [Micromonospora profundi]|uniref:hypothetical protein n=1 Tax=Micromonospora profundi TaxID=1420889 RepID=UPI00365B2D62
MLTAKGGVMGVAGPGLYDRPDNVDRVSGCAVPADLPMLLMADVARLGGVKPETVSKALQRSKSGGRYAGDPFPEPDGRIGGRDGSLSGSRPWWSSDRREAIEAWFARNQDRSGVGGRPPKSAGEK